MTNQLQRDPEDWKTGDEPMTEAQASYLRTLSDEVGEPFEDTLTKAEASKRIDELRERSPRVDTSADAGTTPRPSQAEGGDGGDAGERPPRPSQAEGDRQAE